MLNRSWLTFKLLSLSLIITERQLIHERTASRTSWEKSYDFILVGAGSAGCAIAHRLAKNPNIKVLLLEVGGEQSAIYNDMPAMADNITENRPDLQWAYYNIPQRNAGKQFPGGRIFEPRGRAIGGSSSHHQMIFNRGNRKDFDTWAERYGAKGWSYAEVLPFFKAFENNTDQDIVGANPKYHGTDGLIQISSQKRVPKMFKLLEKAYNEMGFQTIDFNGPKQTGTMNMQLFITSKGFRSSNGNAYVDPNPYPKNLHIVAKALVTKILFNGLTAVGVEFAKNDRPNRVYAKKEVILTAGAINTPQLLMLSGIGLSSHLQSFGIPVLIDLPVGNNFMNHPNVLIRSKIFDPSLHYPLPQLSIKFLSQLYFEGKGRLSEHPANGLFFSTSSIKDKDWPNQLFYSFIENDTLFQNLNVVRPRSRGTVRLQSNSPYTHPLIDSSFLSHPQDFEDTVEAMKYVFYILEKSSIAPYISPPSFESIGCPVCPNKYRYECTEGIRCFILYNTDTAYHTSGGCRMGAVEREDVVVDPNLNVKHVKNLRICDSSIFPLLPNANTNSPATMVGEKCAAIIKNFYHIH